VLPGVRKRLAERRSDSFRSLDVGHDLENEHHLTEERLKDVAVHKAGTRDRESKTVPNQNNNL